MSSTSLPQKLPLKRLSILPPREPISDDGYQLMVNLVSRVNREATKSKVLNQTRSTIMELCEQFSKELKRLKVVLSGGEEEVEAAEHETITLAAETYRTVLPEIEALLHQIYKKLSLIRSERFHEDVVMLLCTLVGNSVLDETVSLLKDLSSKFEEIQMEKKFTRKARENCLKLDKEQILDTIKALITNEKVQQHLPNETIHASNILGEAENKGLDVKATLTLLGKERVIYNLHQGATSISEQMTANISEDELKIEGLLYAGSFGPLMSATLEGQNYPDSPRVVAKQVARMPFLSIAARREVQIQSLKNHSKKYSNEYLIKFYGTCIKDEYYLVYDLYEKSLSGLIFGDGDDEADDLKEFSNRRILSFALDIMSGIRFLHSKSVYHGSLNPSNIFVRKDKHLVISNFGYEATKTEYKRYANRHQMTYLAPEVIEPRDQVWTYAADIYSFSVVLWEMIEMSKAYEDIEFEKLIKAVKHKRERPMFSAELYPAKMRIPSFLRNLVNQCWAQTPKERPTAKEVFDMIDLQVKEANAGSSRRSFLNWFKNEDENIDESNTLEDQKADKLQTAEATPPPITYTPTASIKPNKTPEELLELLENNDDSDAENAGRILKLISQVANSNRKSRVTLASEGLADAILETMETHHDNVSVLQDALQALRILAKGQRAQAIKAKAILVEKAAHRGIIKVLEENRSNDLLKVDGYRTLRELCVKSPENIKAIVDAQSVELVCEDIKSDTSKVDLHRECIKLLYHLLNSRKAQEIAVGLEAPYFVKIIVEKNEKLVAEQSDSSIDYFGKIVIDRFQEYLQKLNLTQL